MSIAKKPFTMLSMMNSVSCFSGRKANWKGHIHAE